MGVPDHLTCLLRNLYAGQEATVRTRHGTTDWFKIGKGVHLGYILSLCRVHHVKCQAGYLTTWNEHYWEKYQQLQIWRWYHSNGRKQVGNKEHFDKGGKNIQWILSFKPAFSLSSFTFIKRLFSSFLLSAIRVVSSAYLRLLLFFLAVLIPACASSNPAVHIDALCI